MADDTLTEQQARTCENLRQGAISLLDVQDAVKNGNFEAADQMLAKVEEAVGFTRVALYGMQLLQEAQDI